MADFTQGDRIQVRPGAAHEEGQTTGVISIVNPGPAYGITFDGMEGVHKWYVAEELAPAAGSDEFQSGMPRQLRNYWIHGAGAARIRWGTPGAFDRCVRNLTQESHGTIRDPKGTCANLYHEATGKWPGAHRGEEHNLDVLIAAMGDYTPTRWRGPLAPINKPTGDNRMFPPHTLTFQTFPMPLRWQEHGTRGHDGAVTVGVIEGAYERDNEIVGFGYFLDPNIIPEVKKALHQVEHGVAGPSVDLDSYSARMMMFASKPTQVVSEGRTRAATLVAVPAFADLRLELNPPDVDEPVEDEVPFDLAASAAEFAVNPNTWRSAPIAPREAKFDADDAVKRIQDWANGDASKMSSAFLWVDADRGGGAILGKEGYRLPWGDIIDGKPYLIYHAIYSASALLEDGHGGLPNIPDPDKARLRSVITEIYAKLAKEFNDPNIRASWDRRAEASLEDEDCVACARLDAQFVFWCDDCQDEVVDLAEYAMATEDFTAYTEEFLGRYTEAKHPRDPKGTEEGGEWRDVPGHGPHGQVKIGGKWVYPTRRKDTGHKPRHAAPEKEGRHRGSEEENVTSRRYHRSKHAAPYRHKGAHRAEDKRKAKEPEKKAPPKEPEKKAPPAKKAAPAKKVTPRKAPSGRGGWAKEQSANNPKVINSYTTRNHVTEWWNAVTDDTTEEGIPVRGLTIHSNHEIANGTLYRRNGISYIVDYSTSIPNHQVVDEFEDFHKTLPGDASQYQKAYVWAAHANPMDKLHEQRTGIKGFKSLATAGDGATVVWGRRNKSSGPKSIQDSLNHEFGHNVSSQSRAKGLSSSGFKWENAYKADQEENRTLDLGNITWSWKDHPISTEFKSGQEHPYGVTSYGKTSAEEDYAESTSLYLHGQIGNYRKDGKTYPIYFRDVFPGRAKVMDQVYPKFAEQQQAEVAKRGPIQLRKG